MRRPPGRMRRVRLAARGHQQLAGLSRFGVRGAPAQGHQRQGGGGWPRYGGAMEKSPAGEATSNLPGW